MSSCLLRLIVPMAAVLLAACASTPQVNPGVAAAISSRGVDAGTQAKIDHGQALDYSDILALVQKGVSSNVIIAYLDSTKKTYNFTYSQLQNLKAAGATPQLLNYLTETQGFYGRPSGGNGGIVPKGKQGDRYLRTQAYQNEAPFAYNEPVIDDWYDSSYEESVYSPFSFN